jgi:hypothetical protein
MTLHTTFVTRHAMLTQQMHRVANATPRQPGLLHATCNVGKCNMLRWQRTKIFDKWLHSQPALMVIPQTMLKFNDDVLTYLTSWNYAPIYWCCRCDAVSQSDHIKRDCHRWSDTIYNRWGVQPPVIVYSHPHSWINLSELDDIDRDAILVELKLKYGDDYPYYPMQVKWDLQSE